MFKEPVKCFYSTHQLGPGDIYSSDNYGEIPCERYKVYIEIFRNKFIDKRQVSVQKEDQNDLVFRVKEGEYIRELNDLRNILTVTIVPRDHMWSYDRFEAVF